MQKQQILDQLKQHMQTAIMLEFSTLPPYLCAYWSIHGTSVHAQHTKNLILSVAQEEMLHLAMACNIMNAIGGNPRLNDPSLLPVFPCRLPGHSKTNNPFEVELNKCCPHALETFLRIELPGEMFGEPLHHDGWCTIGEFYNEIESLINNELLDDSDFDHGRQIGNSFNPAKGTLYEVHNRADAIRALEEIIDQGEGHSGKMYDKDHQLTHYWRFKSILDLMQHGIWNYEEDVFNMSTNPDEQYFSPEALEQSAHFNSAWSNLLNEMNAAFNCEEPSLDKSIRLMFKLKSSAVALMQMPLVGKAGNAGPRFSYIPIALRKDVSVGN